MATFAVTEAETRLAEKFRTRISPFIKRYSQKLDQAAAAALLKQFTPDARELEESNDYSDDPLQEEDADIHPFADVVHKYRGKILYLTTDECPVYCRYCTRKRKTLLSEGHQATPLAEIADYMSRHPEVNEVIFSGGDPLMLPVSDLLLRARFFLGIATVRHLRIHTRAVTTAPDLISAKLLSGIAALKTEFSGKDLTFVLHVNTAAELSDDAREKITALRSLEIPLYAQTVLLAEINADAQILAELCRTLLRAGVQPYYLHALDRVTGSAHFEVAEGDAKRIYHELKTLIPAYMTPRFVRDSKQGKYSV